MWVLIGVYEMRCYFLKSADDYFQICLSCGTVDTCTSGTPTGTRITHTCGSTTTGGTCTASCVTGYSGSDETFTCGANGALTGTNPTCTASPRFFSLARVEFWCCVGHLKSEQCCVPPSALSIRSVRQVFTRVIHVV